MIIPDNETTIDLLYYEAISNTIVELLRSAESEAITVGVHGDWGAGKSSVLLMLEQHYESDDQTLFIRFNGWLFQGFEDTKTVLIETILEELLRKQKLSSQAKGMAQQLLERVNWLKLARRSGGFAFNAMTGMPSPDQASSILNAARGLLDSEGDLGKDDIQSFIDEAGGFVNDAKPESVPTQMHAFREEFAALLGVAKIQRLVVVVDDLDRCLPETAIATLEAIRLFLFVPGAAFVIAADEAMIEYAVKKHFPDMPLTTGATSYARNYLEKLIQVPFRLPPLGYVETRSYVTLLLVSLHSDELAKKEFTKLIELTREVLRRPWGGDGFNREKIENALGSIPPRVEEALQLANQIAPILTDGARGNPRQIKRFLNTMTLRMAIAEQRGISSDIRMHVLAKLMLAERFETDLFARIERESAGNGKSTTISQLEKFVKTEKSSESVDNSDSNGLESDENNDLRSNEWARRWAKIEPALAEDDLRPYLFISRDRKAIFGASTTLSLLDEWVDKLCGSKLGARSAADEIAKMPSADAEQVFDAVALRISSAKELTKRPAGIDGLIELCKVHKTLHKPTIALLSNLPTTKLGPWVVTGWSGVFSKNGSQSEFEELIQRWADQDENKILKMAASKAPTK